MEALSLIRFKDKQETNSPEHFGIKFDDGRVLCFCCGGWIYPGGYEILEDYKGFSYLDDTLKEYY